LSVSAQNSPLNLNLTARTGAPTLQEFSVNCWAYNITTLLLFNHFFQPNRFSQTRLNVFRQSILF
jgi:hypothetical protein